MIVSFVLSVTPQIVLFNVTKPLMNDECLERECMCVCVCACVCVCVCMCVCVCLRCLCTVRLLTLINGCINGISHWFPEAILVFSPTIFPLGLCTVPHGLCAGKSALRKAHLLTKVTTNFKLQMERAQAYLHLDENLSTKNCSK